MIDGEELISITQAAAALGKNKSTISRFVNAHPEINRSADGPPKVYLSELRAVRGGEVNEAKSGNHAGQAYGEQPPEDDEECEAHSQATAPAPRSTSTLNAVRTGKEAILMRRQQMMLDQELGQLVPAADVEDAGMELGVILQSTVEAVFSVDLINRIRNASDTRRAGAELEKAKEALFERLDNAAAKAIRAAPGELDEEEWEDGPEE